MASRCSFTEGEGDFAVHSATNSFSQTQKHGLIHPLSVLHTC